MAMRLQLEPWGRLPDLTRPAPPPRRERSSLSWAVPYWVAALAFAYAAHADWVPVRAWLEALAARPSGVPVSVVGPPPAAEPPPVVSEADKRRAAMGVFTAQDDDLQYAALDDGDWEAVPIESDDEAAADEAAAATPDEVETEEETVARTAESTVEPVEPPPRRAERAKRSSRQAERVAAHDPVPAEPDRDSPTPAGRARPRTRQEALAAAVDEALGRFRISARSSARGEDEPDAPSSAPSRKRRGGGKVLSCEAAIAAYKEEWTIGKSSGPRDLTAEQYGAVLNGGAYFRHCGVPGRMGVKICAAVQNGQAVGVTVTTSPRSSKISRCIAGAVRGLSFPSHPRMDVTTTVFKPTR